MYKFGAKRRMHYVNLWLALLFCFACPSLVTAQVTITSPTATSTYYNEDNVAVVSGRVAGNVSSVTYSCESGCNNSGTTSGTSSWTTDRIYLNGGSNLVRVTARYTDGSSDSAVINLYRTIPGSVPVSFPYNLDFDGGASSLEGLIWATDGASVTHQTSGCWSGGCAKFVPSTSDNSYAALGGFNFPANTRRVNVRYLMYFGPDYLRNLNTRHKHILMHRATDVSGDRGMAYIWRTGGATTDLSVGACDNTDCRYEGGKTRPDGTESFLISEHLQEWVSFEVEFDTVNHRVRIYVTTRDGALNDHLLAERQIHSINSSQDYWSRLSVLGAFIDLGTTASPGMYWMTDEVVMSNTHIGPPAGFAGAGTARPNPPLIDP